MPGLAFEKMGSYYFAVQPISPYQSLMPRFFSEFLPSDTAKLSPNNLG